MSLFADIQSLSAAMQSFTYGESITSENIANVDTVGYSTQVLNLASIQDFGGVSVAGVSSTRNTFLFNQIYGQLALQGYTTARLSGLTQLGNIFPTAANAAASDPLNQAIAALVASWKTLSTDSSNPATSPAAILGDQGAVLTNLEAVASEFNADSNQLYTLQQNVNTQVVDTINQVNSLENQILDLNQQIVSLGGQQGAQTSTLIDQREVAAQSLVGLTGGAVAYNTDGAMVVTFSGGTLVDGVNAYHLTPLASTGPQPVLSTSEQPGFTDIGYVGTPNNPVPADVTADFTNGTLGGLLYSRDTDIEQARVSLDKMAFGIIQYSNEVNEAGDNGVGGVPLFTGTKASDMAVNTSVVGNPAEIANTMDPNNPGDLAAMQASMNSINMYSEIESLDYNVGAGIEATAGTPVNPAATLASQLALFDTQPTGPGVMVISAGGNALSVPWTANSTLDSIMTYINQNGGGAIYASLTTTGTGAAQVQTFHIYSNAPLTIYDQSGNLGKALQLAAVLTSSAPINNAPIASLGSNAVNQNLDLGNVVNKAALATEANAPATGGTVEVNGNTLNLVNWTPNGPVAQDSLINILVRLAGAGGTPMDYGFTPVTGTPAQTAELVNLGAGTLAPNVLSQADPLQSVQIQDISGNLTQVLNFSPNTNAQGIYSQMISSIGGDITAVTAEQTQANNLVTATQTLQNGSASAESNVNLDAQLAQAAEYEDAYEAAARMQYVLEDMLNFLITGTGSSNSNQTPIG